MIRKLSILFVVCGLLTAVGCGKAEFQDYSNAEGKYKVQFPGKPKEQTQMAPGGIAMKVAMVEERNGAYMVMFSDMPIPPNEPPAKIQDRLDGAVQGMLQNKGGTVTNNANITVSGKYAGRDVQASITQPVTGLLRGKIIVAGTRFYQVMVLGKPAFANSSDATKFLDSFVLNY